MTRFGSWFPALAIIAISQIVVSMCASAQTLSNRPITIVWPFAAGGGTDVALRVVAQKMSDLYGSKIVIENRAGGAGVIGTMSVKNSAPDGTTLLLGNVSVFASNLSLMAKLPYDPMKDFAPITQLFSQASVLAVPADLPVATITDVVELAKTRPEGLTYAAQSVGAIGHLLGAMLAKAGNVNMTLVPYRGAAPAVIDLLAGRVNVFFTSYGSVHQHVESGKLKLLAITSKDRDPTLPNIPTVAEAGFPTLEMDLWYGLAAPVQTPPGIVDLLNNRFVAAARSPNVVDSLRAHGIQVVTSTPPEFQSMIEKEIIRYRTILTELGVKPQ